MFIGLLRVGTADDGPIQFRGRVRTLTGSLQPEGGGHVSRSIKNGVGQLDDIIGTVKNKSALRKIDLLSVKVFDRNVWSKGVAIDDSRFGDFNLVDNDSVE